MEKDIFNRFFITLTLVAVGVLNCISFGITASPTEVTFNCGNIEPLSTQSSSELEIQSTKPLLPQASIRAQNFEFFRPQEKIVREGELQDQLDDEGFADILITLDYEHPSVVNSGKALPEKVQLLQEQLMCLPDLDGAQIGKIFSNVPAVHLKVDAATLEYLKTCDLVAGIESPIEVHTQTAQGVPLMGADVYRPIYGGAGTAVAIIDSGIDYNHSALGGGGFPNSKVIGGYDFGDDDADPMAGATHGTNCAGLAAGDIVVSGDYIGGVAPDAKLYALKVMTGTSGSTDTTKLISAIDWCVDHQYDDPQNPILAISMSLGSSRYTTTCDGASSSFTNAVNSAVAAGITVLSSSGNNGYCDAIGFPACLTNVVSVGAVFDADFGSNISFCLSEESCIGTTSSSCTNPETPKLYTADPAADMIAQYSNSSSLVDVLASAHHARTPTNGGSYYSTFGGTSAACAYAAGAVVALQSAVIDISGSFLTPSQVRDVLKDNGDPIADWKNSITTPRINVANAIEFSSVFGGEQITITNTSSRTANITGISSPAWVSVYPQPPVSIAGNDNALFYASADCGYCDNENRIGDIIFSGSRFPNTTLSETVTANMICPQCELMANLAGDCEVDWVDFAILADCWLSEATECQAADITGTGIVGMTDLEVMAGEWLEGK